MTPLGYFLRQAAIYLGLLCLVVLTVTLLRDGTTDWGIAKGGLLGAVIAPPLCAYLDLRRWKERI